MGLIRFTIEDQSMRPFRSMRSLFPACRAAFYRRAARETGGRFRMKKKSPRHGSRFSEHRHAYVVACLLAALCFASVGCSTRRHIEPLTIANPFLGPAGVAVAPAVNVSGSNDFDPNRFADLMASELGFADRVTVIPVSRVLGAMALQGRDQVTSPQQALDLAELVGADAILVFAVTEYDAFDPPRIGITAQLFGVTPWHQLGEPPPDQQRGQLLAQTQRVFSAAHADVVQEIQQYAAQRDADQSPFGWQRYVVSQQHFIRFCCHATIRSLLSGDRSAVVARGNGSGR